MSDLWQSSSTWENSMAVTEISLILMHDSSHVRKWNLQCLKQDDFFSGARSAVPNSLDSSNLLKRLERWFIFAFKSAARSLKKGFIFTFKRLYEPSLQENMNHLFKERAALKRLREFCPDFGQALPPLRTFAQDFL
jgi:hypothetical protein